MKIYCDSTTTAWFHRSQLHIPHMKVSRKPSSFWLELMNFLHSSIMVYRLYKYWSRGTFTFLTSIIFEPMTSQWIADVPFMMHKLHILTLQCTFSCLAASPDKTQQCDLLIFQQFGIPTHYNLRGLPLGCKVIIEEGKQGWIKFVVGMILTGVRRFKF